MFEDPCTVLEGDCLDLLPTLPAQCVDLILCDLPYGTTACKWDVVIPFEPLWKQYKRIIKKNGVIVLTASQPFTSQLVMSNPKWFRYCWVWDKKLPSGAVNCNRIPLKRHEDVAVFYEKAGSFKPQMREGIFRKKGGGGNGAAYGFMPSQSSWNKDYFPTSILEFSNADLRNRLHPTQKPVALMEYLIRTYTNEGDLVLDNCMGSGTTGVAALNTGRRFIGIEREPAYCKIARERIAGAKTLWNTAA